MHSLLSIKQMWVITLSLVVFDIALVMQLFAHPGAAPHRTAWDFRIDELRQLEAHQFSHISAMTGRAVLGEVSHRQNSSTYDPIRLYFPGLGSVSDIAVQPWLLLPAEQSGWDADGQVL